MITDEMIEHQLALDGYREGGPRWTAHSVRDTYERLLDAKEREEKASDITVRDYFAAKALQGYLAGHAGDKYKFPEWEHVSKMSYEIADAMLKARNK
jgi:hypothetical protein